MSETTKAVLVPKPPPAGQNLGSVSSDGAMVPQKPPSDFRPSAHRRALAVLLRQVENNNSSAADTSDGNVQKAPRRSNGRSKALLKELYAIDSLDDLIAHEAQLRAVVGSNEMRQRTAITTEKLLLITLREEQQIIICKEASNRRGIAAEQENSNLCDLLFHHLVFEEFTSRNALQEMYPPAPLRIKDCDIRLRRTRTEESRERLEVLEGLEHVLFLECFGRYILESEFWQDWPAFRAGAATKMSAEHSHLSYQHEERELCEVEEYVERDTMESMYAQQLNALVTALHRDGRRLRHNDVQTIETRRRRLLAGHEDQEYHHIVHEFYNTRRVVAGGAELAKLGTMEHKWRNEITSEESSAFRSFATAALRDWHAVHQKLLQQSDATRSIDTSERLRRHDVTSEYFEGLQELMLKARTHHNFVAHRDWERKHVMETYIDGRIAIWKQQNIIVDEMFQEYQKQSRLLSTTSWSVVLGDEESAKRELIRSEQWKVFMLFYLWSAVQRFKVTSVQTMQHTMTLEEQARSRLLKQFDAEKELIQNNPLVVFARKEAAKRAIVVEWEVDHLLMLYENFKLGRRDLTACSLEVGSLVTSSMESAERRRVVLEENFAWYDVRLEHLKDSVCLEKTQHWSRRESFERTVLYSRILEIVEDWCRADMECDEETIRMEIEQNRIINEELVVRVALDAHEQERFQLLRKMFDSVHARIVNIERNELDERLSIVAEAEVRANTIGAYLACGSTACYGGSKTVVAYGDNDLRRELRLYDGTTFAQELEKEMMYLRSGDEPNHRRVVVVNEHHQFAQLTAWHQEAVERDLLQKQQRREFDFFYGAVERTNEREAHRSKASHQAPLAAAEWHERATLDIESRASLLAMFERQEELYRQADLQIKLRLLLEEGPLIDEYFKQADDIASLEEITREGLQSAMQLNHSLVKSRERSVLEDNSYREGDHDDYAHYDVTNNTTIMDTTAPLDTASTTSGATAGYIPTTHELVLHSLQLSLMSKYSDAPLSVQVASKSTNHQNHRGKAECSVDVVQRVCIGAKTLLVLQPAADCASQFSWAVAGNTHVVVEVWSGPTLLAEIAKSFSEEECLDPQNSVLSVPLQAVATGASGKVHFVVEVR